MVLVHYQKNAIKVFVHLITAILLILHVELTVIVQHHNGATLVHVILNLPLQVCRLPPFQLIMTRHGFLPVQTIVGFVQAIRNQVVVNFADPAARIVYMGVS